MLVMVWEVAVVVQVMGSLWVGGFFVVSDFCLDLGWVAFRGGCCIFYFCGFASWVFYWGFPGWWWCLILCWLRLHKMGVSRFLFSVSNNRCFGWTNWPCYRLLLQLLRVVRCFPGRSPFNQKLLLWRFLFINSWHRRGQIALVNASRQRRPLKHTNSFDTNCINSTWLRFLLRC